MEFTFGIITNKGNLLNIIIESIYNLNIPKDKYEIVIVGNCDIEYSENIKKIDFDESIKSGWITKKKNLITINSTKENIVFLHDYYVFDSGWYKGFLSYGNEWDICSNPQYNPDGSRFRDWVLHECHYDNFGFQGDGRLIPYDNESGNYVYINGSYWVAKRQAMIEAPLDENRCWGESEDLAWSKYIKWKRFKIQFNPNSICRLLKAKDTVFCQMDGYFYDIHYKPFIFNKTRNNNHFENNMKLYEETCSLLRPYLQEDLSEKYIKSRMK
jgi:hypothetical protein